MPSRPIPDPVAVLAARRDRELTCELLARAGLPGLGCTGFEELIVRLQKGNLGAAVVADEAIPAGGTRQLMDALAQQPAWSDVPVIMLSTTGSMRRASELVLQTNVTVLERPVGRSTMLSAIRAALRARSRQHQLRELLERKDEFLAMLGHELRNPLAVIVNSSQLMSLARDPLDSQRHRAVVERQARHLARMVDDLLDVSRVTLGKVALTKEVVDLREIATRCVHELEATASQREQQLVLHTDPQPIWVHGDVVRLEQILINLVTNAIRYTPEHGRIDVHVRERDSAEVVVKDTGQGIDPAAIPGLFDLFSQGEQVLARTRGGLGLGLYIVQLLVQLHGGEVAARSQGVGRGSEFSVRFPMVGRPQLASKAVAPRDPVQPLRILVIEDNEDARETMQELLRLQGHQVQSAGDGLAGAKLIVQERPDVALVDIGLPTLDGYAVARHVRERGLRTTHLIALTGYGQPRDQELALEAGFDDHLVKPVDFDKLSRLLNRAAKQPRKQPTRPGRSLVSS